MRGFAGLAVHLAAMPKRYFASGHRCENECPRGPFEPPDMNGILRRDEANPLGERNLLGAEQSARWRGFALGWLQADRKSVV